MGANSSKQEILNETLNEVMINVMTNNSTAISGSVEQINDISIVGSNNVSYSGFKQLNTSNINVSALAQSKNNSTLQADLISKLSSKVEQVTPLISIGSDSDQRVKNSIKNAITSNITTNNLQNISAQIKQTNRITNIGDSNVSVTNTSQVSEATLVMKLVNDTTSQIVAAVKAESTLDSTTSQKPAALLDFSAGGIILIVIIVIIGGFLYYVKSSGLAIAEIVAKPQVIALIIFLIGLSAFGVYESTKK